MANAGSGNHPSACGGLGFVDAHQALGLLTDDFAADGNCGGPLDGGDLLRVLLSRF
jgi:hypothetical protein